MMLREPQAHQYDWKWRLFGIPVRVSPWFWGVVVLMGLGGLNIEQGGPRNLAIMGAWVLTCLISILAHEFGHALTGRLFGSRNVRISLYGLGGVTISADGGNRKNWRQRVMVIAAGPAVSIALGLAFLVLAVMIRQGRIAISNLFVRQFVWNMLWVNLFWAALNLMPIYPLDGGQICANIISAWRPVDGILWTYRISIVVGFGLALLLLLTVRGFMFVSLLFAYLAYTNYMNLQRATRGGFF